LEFKIIHLHAEKENKFREATDEIAWLDMTVT
jgi:hypothetical protein